MMFLLTNRKLFLEKGSLAVLSIKMFGQVFPAFGQLKLWLLVQMYKLVKLMSSLVYMHISLLSV